MIRQERTPTLPSPWSGGGFTELTLQARRLLQFLPLTRGRLREGCLAAVLMWLLWAGVASAQYNPIPNFNGNLAGQQFRNAINSKLNGQDTIAPQLVHIFFYQLPAIVTNGQMYYVTDGANGTPCAGGGNGAFALGVNGQWSCGSTPSSVQNLSQLGFNAAANSCYSGGTDSGSQNEHNYTLCGNGANAATVLSFGSGAGPNLTHTYNLTQPASGVIDTWTFAAGGGASVVCPIGTCPDSLADYPANACTANGCVDRVTVQYIASSNTYFLTVDGR